MPLSVTDIGGIVVNVGATSTVRFRTLAGAPSGAVGLLLVALVANPARAAAAAPISDEEVVNQVDEITRSALRKIEAGRFDAARKLLVDAERMAKGRGGVVAGEVLATTYLLLGVVEIMAGGDVAQAKRQFRRALCRQPRILLGGPIAAHAGVVSAFDAVKAAPGGQPECQRLPEAQQRLLWASREPSLPVRIQALDCPTLDEALAGTDFIVRCALAPKLPVAKVFLRYRPPGSDEYAAVEMRRTTRGWWTAAVPGKDIAGRSLLYYFEGRNAAGQPMVVNGQAESPNIALVISPELCGCN